MPTADEMERIEKLLPGATERFLAQWERETVHRHGLEDIQYQSIAGEITELGKDRRLGLVVGSLIAVIALGAITYGVFKGVDLKALGGLFIAAGMLVWAVRRSTKDIPVPPQPPRHNQTPTG